MALLAGTRLGPYEILAPIGEGGMGEVYKAKDTRLDRTVAIKVLREQLALSPERKQRFEREAKAISKLNHPHICILYDVGNQDGTDYLVMEYIEGETLAERLKKGALPLDKALEYGIQITDGLDTAHRAGIVHRDLKPANLILTKSGIKLLDFGLAKPVGDEPFSDSSDAPTRQKNITKDHAIIGTLQYMAPEQLEGKTADARTDIFAFGEVLYEMVTGSKAFEGKSEASLIAAILDAEPPAISNLQPVTPPMLDRVVKKCLAKDPEDRWHTAHDLRDELTWIAEGGSLPTGPTGTSERAHGRQAIPLALATLAVGGTLIGVAVWNFKPSPPPPAPAQFVVTTPPDGPLRLTGSQTDLAISPDGARIAYMTQSGGTESRHFYVRDLDQLVATPLLGSERARSPFFSPDGEWVGFQVSGGSDSTNLKKVSVLGGRSVTICQSPTGALLGVSWGPDHTIVFSTFRSKGLLRVPAVGGEPEELTSVNTERDEVNHTWPEFLPGGDAILFNIVTDRPTESNQIAVLSLATGEQKMLVANGSNPRYSPTGHVVYGVDGTLWAVPFDLDGLAVTGDPVPVLEDVITKGSGAVNFSFSGDGSLVYVSGTTASTTQSVLVLVDRNGRETPMTEITADYLSPRFSSDGRHVAFAVAETEGSITDSRVDVDIWVMEVDRGTRTRLTFGANNLFPTWSPDNRRVAFAVSETDGRRDLYSAPIDGSGLPEELFVRDGRQFVTSWSSDARAIAYYETNSETGQDLWVLSLDGDKTPSPFLVSPFEERAGTFSPDGRFIAYVSNESGQYEVYVRPYPGPGGAVIVSTGGGTEPVWARDGTELFYRKGEQMLVTEVETERTFSVRAATVLFEGRYEADRHPVGGIPNYDVSPDGQQFVMVRRTGEGERVAPPINIVLNWFQELERLVPTDN